MINFAATKKGGLLVKTYINGKKSALLLEAGNLYLMSHCAAWDGQHPANMYGWKDGALLCPETTSVSVDEVKADITKVMGWDVKEITFEGEDLYNTYRANINTRKKDEPTQQQPTQQQPTQQQPTQQQPTQQQPAQQQPTQQQPTQQQPAALPTMDAATTALAGLFGGVANNVTAQVMAQVHKLIDPIINAAPVIHEVKVTLPDGTSRSSRGAKHQMFDVIAKYVAMGRSVYLYGPAGTGKTTIARQVADITGREFYSTSCIQEEFSLCGYNAADGRYIGTQFYKACKRASEGVKVEFTFDELDTSNPMVIKKFNTALANRYFDFPCGRVEWEDGAFVAVGTGNTCGTGATAEYNTAYKMDESTRDRFKFVFVDYCPAIEEACSRGNKELLKFCREMRKAATAAGVSLTISYRGIQGLAEDVECKVADLPLLLNANITTGMDKDEINMILGQLSLNDEYTDALRKLAA